MWAGLWVGPPSSFIFRNSCPAQGGAPADQTRFGPWPPIWHMPCPRVDATEVLKFVSRACGAEWAQAGAAYRPRARKGKSLVHPYATHPACTQRTMLAALVRKLLLDPASRSHIRRGTFFLFNHWDRYQSLGLLLFARYDGAQYTLVAVNTTGNEQTVPFWFPVGGDYREELHGGDLDLEGVPALKEHALTIPSHYGRIWTRASANPHASIPSPSFAPGNRFVRADPAKDPKKLGRARRT